MENNGLLEASYYSPRQRGISLEKNIQAKFHPWRTGILGRDIVENTAWIISPPTSTMSLSPHLDTKITG